MSIGSVICIAVYPALLLVSRTCIMPPFLEHIRKMAHRRMSYMGECSHVKVAPTVITLNPKGDLVLMVGRQKCTDKACNELGENRRHYDNAICFHVDSEVLAGASVSFGFVLYSPSGVTAKRDHVKWDVSLPDDDPHAMLTIINILYDRYNPTPGQPIDLGELANLAILADKYDLVHLLSKWAPQWMWDMEPYWDARSFLDCSTEDLELLLWICWVLGHEPLYVYMILQIAAYGGHDAAGRLTDPTEQLCFTDELREVKVPPYVAAEIGHARIEILRVIRKEIKATLEEHLHGIEHDGHIRCVRLDGEEDRAWRRSALRAFVEALKSEELWPLPPASHITTSAKSLEAFFERNHNLPAFTHRGFDGRFCDTDGTFGERIGKLTRSIRFYVPAVTGHHLSKQAIESGLDEYYQSMGLKLDMGSWSVNEVVGFINEAATRRLTVHVKGKAHSGKPKNQTTGDGKAKTDQTQNEKTDCQGKEDHREKRQHG
ncbi:hypothetical protein F5Y17DRAFT_405909 [Xylariaceae sp. FL0594]|nr:hypothetical protein F5Y17DRAFT_405909 [Xylariaceae sp. FL0594]